MLRGCFLQICYFFSTKSCQHFCLRRVAARQSVIVVTALMALRSGEIRYSPSCLDLGFVGRLAYEEELGASKLSCEDSAAPTVMGITVLDDDIGKPRSSQIY